MAVEKQQATRHRHVGRSRRMWEGEQPLCSVGGSVLRG